MGKCDTHKVLNKIFLDEGMCNTGYFLFVEALFGGGKGEGVSLILILKPFILESITLGIIGYRKVPEKPERVSFV